MAKNSDNADCQARRDLVLAYVKSSTAQRAHFDQEAIKRAFWHIDWCWNNLCANLWCAIGNKDFSGTYKALENDPEFLTGLDQEIRALLQWARRHTSLFQVYGFVSAHDPEIILNEQLREVKKPGLPN